MSDKERIKCEKCKGSGMVPFSRDLSETFALIPETGTISTTCLYEKLGAKDQPSAIGITAINNRLRRLENAGFVHCIGKESRTFLWERAHPKTHVDDWLDYARWVDNTVERYVRLFLEIARMPAAKSFLYEGFVDKPITCDFSGERFRLTGASRFGDVLLSADLSKKTGYTRRVCITDCTNWEVEGLK